jgi:hypothetical protein
VLEGSGVQVIENNFLNLLLNFLGFPQDNITLAFNGGLLKLRVL